MKKSRVVISTILALCLLALLLVLGTGLLRFGWVDIPYQEIVSAKISNTLQDGFQFEVTDPYHIETLTKALDGLGPMVNTPKGKQNGSLYSLTFKTAEGQTYAMSIRDEKHLTTGGRRYSTDLEPIIRIVASLEETARAGEREKLSDLFYRALYEQTLELGRELAEAFSDTPEEFLTLLALESYEIRGAVQTLLTQYHTDVGSTLTLIQFLLDMLPGMSEKFSGQERSIVFNLLITCPVDVSNAGADFTHSLLDAFPYTDAALTTQCNYILSLLFEKDPAGLVKIIAQEDAPFRESLAYDLVYSVTYSSRITKFLENVNILSQDDTLTEAEQEVVAQLMANLAEYDEEALTPPETIAPIDETQAVETATSEYFVYEFEDGALRLFMEPAEKIQRFTVDLKTHTQQINVYWEHIPEDVVITVSFYRDSFLNKPFCTGTLSSQNQSVHCGSLSSDEIYIVGLEIPDLKDFIAVYVTDQPVK